MARNLTLWPRDSQRTAVYTADSKLRREHRPEMARPLPYDERVAILHRVLDHFGVPRDFVTVRDSPRATRSAWYDGGPREVVLSSGTLGLTRAYVPAHEAAHVVQDFLGLSPYRESHGPEFVHILRDAYAAAFGVRPAEFAAAFAGVRCARSLDLSGTVFEFRHAYRKGRTLLTYWLRVRGPEQDAQAALRAHHARGHAAVIAARPCPYTAPF